MTTILLIRHGENDFVGRRLAGRLPGVHLNDKGRRQALETAETLKDSPIKAVYSSPLERAMETAQPLAIRLGLSIQIVPELAEIDFGSWQGKTTRQMHRMKMWKKVVEQPSQVQFPGGESFTSAQNRMSEAVKTIILKHADTDWVACFSHSDAIRLAIAYFLNMPLDDFQKLCIDPASISVLRFREGFPSLERLNFYRQWNDQDINCK